MADPTPFPPGAPCWLELYVADPDLVLPFYSEMFGWTQIDQGPDFGGYRSLLREGVPVGGCMKNDGLSGAPDCWFVSLTTDDTEDLCTRAVAAGAQVVVPPMPIGDMGVMAVITDPGGAAVGVWQARQFAGFGVVGDPGAPSWFELQTRDYDASVAFYRDVFGWDAVTAMDSPEMRYTTLGEGDDGRAGIADASSWLPEGVPSHWGVYFAVEDCAAAAQKVTELGGTVTMGPESTPYGTIALVADPGGTIFRLRDLKGVQG